LGLLVFLAFGNQYRINAAYTASVASSVISLVIVRLGRKNPLQLRLHRAVIRPLFTLGISLLIYNLAHLIYTTADRWLVLRLLTTEDMGYYHFVIRAVGAATMIPTAFSAVLYPRMMEMYGAKGKKEDLRRAVYVSSSLFSLVSPFVLVSVYCLVQFVVRFYLPEYEPSMSFFAILILGVYCSLSSVGIGNFLLATNKQNAMTLVLALATVIKVAVGYGLVRAGYGLAGVAVGTVIVYFFMSVCYITWVFKHFEATNWLVFRRLLRLYTPLPMMLGAHGLSSWLGPVLVPGTSIVAQLGQTMVQLLGFCAVFGLPAYVLADRDKHLKPYLDKSWQQLRRNHEGAIEKI